MQALPPAIIPVSRPELSSVVAATLRPSIIFSVDLEDWAQSTLDHNLPIGEHCANNAYRLLDLLSSAADEPARTTFFILGKFAEKHPDVVRRIVADGHEAACHGYGHVPLHDLDPNSFREDLRRAVGIISDIIGERVRGYRAPVFSICSRTLWALEILQEEGFRYDSSIFPIAGPRYGIPNWPDEPRTVQLPNGRSITEFPLTALSVAGYRLPVSGGGYARLLPGWVLRRAFAREAQRRSSWPVFYCHPHEIDSEEFRRVTPPPPWGTARLALKTRLHQGLGRRGFASKLQMLLKHFRFRSFDEALSSMNEIPQLTADSAVHGLSARDPAPCD